MLASWSYNQACLMWQVCLLVKYNNFLHQSKICVCVCTRVCLSVSLSHTHGEEIDTDIFTTHLLTLWVWNDWVSFFCEWRQWLGFWGILSQYLTSTLYGEHMPEVRITGLKIDLDLSAGSTYMRVYIVHLIVNRYFTLWHACIFL